MGLDGSKGHPVFNQKIPGDRVKGSCLFTQMVPLQLVAKIPGEKIPKVLWDNKVLLVFLHFGLNIIIILNFLCTLEQFWLWSFELYHPKLKCMLDTNLAFSVKGVIFWDQWISFLRLPNKYFLIFGAKFKNQRTNKKKSLINDCFYIQSLTDFWILQEISSLNSNFVRQS